jgi:hypothetical protein
VHGENLTNYFNYFTEIEEHFQRARGTSLFLLSPLDWALIETWKNSDVPLEAVLRGIDLAFEKWRSKKSRVQMVNSLAYCSQAIMKEAQRMADGGQHRDKSPQPSPFPAEDLRRFIENNVNILRATEVPDFIPVAESLGQICTDLDSQAPNPELDLELLEQRLTVLEQQLVAIARARQTEDKAIRMRSDLESYLRPWRSRMTAPQIAMLQSQFLEQATLEAAGLPRLSLFYLR